MISRIGCLTVASVDDLVAFGESDGVAITSASSSTSLPYKLSRFSVGFVPHGLRFCGPTRLLAWGSNKISVIDVQTGQSSNKVADDWVLACVVAPDGSVLAVTSRNHVEIFTNTGTKTKVFSDVSALLYSASITIHDTTVTVFGGAVLSNLYSWSFDLRTLNRSTPLMTASEHKGSIFSVSHYPEHSRVLTSSDDRSAILWCDSTLKPLMKFVGHNARVWHACLTGLHVATACEDAIVRVFEADTGKEISRFSGHRNDVWSVAPLTAGCVSSGEDGDVKVWRWGESIESEICARQKRDHDDWIRDLLWLRSRSEWLTVNRKQKAADGSVFFVTEVASTRIFLWLGDDSGTVRAIHQVTHGAAERVNCVDVKVVSLVACLARFPDHEDVALVANHAGSIQLLKASFDRLAITIEILGSVQIKLGGNKISFACFLDSSTIAIADERGNLHLWNKETGLVSSFNKCVGAGAKILSLVVDRDVPGGGCDKILVTATDSKNGVHALEIQTSPLSLCVVSSRKLHEINQIHGSLPNHCIFYGFYGSEFIAWNYKDDCIVSRIPCGGSKGKWAVSFDSFAYLSDDGRLQISRFSPNYSLYKGVSTSTINGMVVVQAPGESSTHPERKSLIIAASEDNSLRVFSAIDLSIIQIESSAHSSSVRCVAWDGASRLISAGAKSEVRLWETGATRALTLIKSTRLYEVQKKKRVINGANDCPLSPLHSIGDIRIMAACFDENTRNFLLGDSAGRVTGFDPETNVWSTIVDGLDAAVLSMKFDSYRKAVLIGLTNGQLVRTSSTTRQVRLHTAGINGLASNSEWVVTGGDDQRICVLSGDSMEVKHVLDLAHHSSIRSLDMIGSLVVSIGWDKRIRKWTVSAEGKLEKDEDKVVIVNDPSSVVVLGDRVVVGGRGIQMLS